MRIVIDIPEGTYKAISVGTINQVLTYKVWRAIQNGTPLPKGHGRLIDADKFLERVKKDREHEIYLHSWTADMVLERLDSWYAPTIIAAEKRQQDED